MAFIFNSTIGDALANSYIDVQASDDYFGGKIDGEAWINLALAEKEQLLATATTRLESELFGGSVADNIQSLQWPRTGVQHRNYPVELEYAITEIPKEIQLATFELGIYFLRRSLDELGLAAEYDQETLESYKVGPLDIKIKSGMTVEKLPTPVKRMLSSGNNNLWLGSGVGGINRSAVRG